MITKEKIKDLYEKSNPYDDINIIKEISKKTGLEYQFIKEEIKEIEKERTSSFKKEESPMEKYMAEKAEKARKLQEEFEREVGAYINAIEELKRLPENQPPFGRLGMSQECTSISEKYGCNKKHLERLFFGLDLITDSDSVRKLEKAVKEGLKQ